MNAAAAARDPQPEAAGFHPCIHRRPPSYPSNGEDSIQRCTERQCNARPRHAMRGCAMHCTAERSKAQSLTHERGEPIFSGAALGIAVRSCAPLSKAQSLYTKESDLWLQKKFPGSKSHSLGS